MTCHKMILIGIDGLRVDDALAGGAAPHLSALVSRGALAWMRMKIPTLSGPGWSTILTGVPHDVHRVFDNTFSEHALLANPDVLSRAHLANPRATTFAAVGWPPLVDPAGPGPVVRTRAEQQLARQHRIIVRDGELYGYRYADGEISACSRLAIEHGPDASFVYLGEVDEAGHLHGGASPEYLDAVKRVDTHLAALIAAVRRRASANDELWLIAVTTDHGHLDEGGHGGGEDVVTRSFCAIEMVGAHARPYDLDFPERMAPHDIAGLLLRHLAMSATCPHQHAGAQT